MYRKDEDGPRFICTATAFARELPHYYLLITAGHCVDSILDGDQFAVARDIGEPLLPVKVLRYELESDVDFAELELYSAQEITVIPLAAKYDRQPGDRVFIPNFSDGLPKQSTEGLISSPVFNSTEIERNRLLFLIHAFGAPGVSGAAVISEDNHRVVGIITTGFHNQIGLGAEPINKYILFLRIKEID